MSTPKTNKTQETASNVPATIPTKNSRAIDRVKAFEKLNAVKQKDGSFQDLFTMGKKVASLYWNQDTESAVLPVTAMAINFVEKYAKKGNRGFRVQFETTDGLSVAGFSNAVLDYALRFFLFAGAITEEMLHGEERLPDSARIDFDSPVYIGVKPKTFESDEPGEDGTKTRKTYELETLGGEMEKVRKLVDGNLLLVSMSDDGEDLPDPVPAE